MANLSMASQASHCPTKRRRPSSRAGLAISFQRNQSAAMVPTMVAASIQIASSTRATSAVMSAWLAGTNLAGMLGMSGMSGISTGSTATSAGLAIGAASTAIDPASRDADFSPSIAGACSTTGSAASCAGAGMDDPVSRDTDFSLAGSASSTGSTTFSGGGIVEITETEVVGVKATGAGVAGFWPGSPTGSAETQLVPSIVTR